MKRRSLLISLAAPLACRAAGPALVERTAPVVLREVDGLLRRFAAVPPDSRTGVQRRMELFSGALLHRSFAWNPVGEGAGAFDDDPPLVLDRFDCLTYVETVLALARSRNTAEVFDDLSQLRYGGNSPAFSTRKHFASVDWLPAALRAGLLADRTKELADGSLGAVQARIDRGDWFGRLARNPMYRDAFARVDLTREGEMLREWAGGREPSEAALYFVPRRALLASLSKRGAHALQSGSILAVVRPATPFSELVGGGEPLSHFGIAICSAAGWLLRATSVTYRSVVDRPLHDALRGRNGLPAAEGCLVFEAVVRPGA